MRRNVNIWKIVADMKIQIILFSVFFCSLQTELIVEHPYITIEYFEIVISQTTCVDYYLIIFSFMILLWRRYAHMNKQMFAKSFNLMMIRRLPTTLFVFKQIIIEYSAYLMSWRWKIYQQTFHDTDIWFNIWCMQKKQ